MNEGCYWDGMRAYEVDEVKGGKMQKNRIQVTDTTCVRQRQR